MGNNAEQARQGLEYAKNILNTINVTGIDNCHKLVIAHNNLDVFLSKVSNGEILISDNVEDNIEKSNSD